MSSPRAFTIFANSPCVLVVQLRVRSGAQESHRLFDLHVHAHGLDPPDWEHVVSVAGGFHPGGELGLRHLRKNEVAKHHEMSIRLCQIHLKAQDTEAAWQDYQEYLNTGGNRMPVATWLELCRIAEGQQNFERAVAEYANLAEVYPNERQSILQLLSAGWLSLKKLNRSSECASLLQSGCSLPGAAPRLAVQH